MDRRAIEEFFAFTEYSWRAWADAIRPFGDAVLTRPAPGSGWPALRDALVHINWAYVRWLSDARATSDRPPEDVSTWEELDGYRHRLRTAARSALDALTDTGLYTPRAMEVDGETLRYSRSEIFVHVLLHERQHHGDLGTLLYQLGIDAPIVEYRFSLPDRRLI